MWSGEAVIVIKAQRGLCRARGMLGGVVGSPRDVGRVPDQLGALKKDSMRVTWRNSHSCHILLFPDPHSLGNYKKRGIIQATKP